MKPAALRPILARIVEAAITAGATSLAQQAATGATKVAKMPARLDAVEKRVAALEAQKAGKEGSI